jgi:hypothetical protein
MAITDADYKLLWGRAAGICSNPGCREDLTVILDSSASYNIGEMAHIIAKSPGGPRGQQGGGTNEYRNLILLCPTCHSRIDKAPTEFPADQLMKWKADHELEIRRKGIGEKFDSLQMLKHAVSRLLAENRVIWSTIGPKSHIASSDAGSNLHVLWDLRKLDTILPNNRRIINLIEANGELLSQAEREGFLLFKNHALAFERHQFDRLDAYPTFPESFQESFRP